MTIDDNSWWSLTCTPAAGTEVRSQLEDLLYSVGCGGIWDHTAMIGQGENCPGNPEASLLTAYFPGGMQPFLAQLSQQLESRNLVSDRPRIQAVENEDWLDGWRKNFTLTPLTAQTLVVPSWQELPAAETRLGIKIYPGQGFGTGTHETTRLAASFLENELRDDVGADILDVGTGSGILSILAAKRGASRILALDIDEEALVNARENCAHNRVCDQVILDSCPLTEVQEKFTLIVANIIAPVLLQLAPEFPRLLKPGGRLILSGILVDQLPELKKNYADLGLLIKSTETMGEWTAFVCEKRVTIQRK
ncbi:MAG: 50S ribosomal protein L11 methyltransferase [Pseudomonadota bacterium]|nr:50S ribosomal protein L11 methyltransferase [Pseudomonadota bacterium]